MPSVRKFPFLEVTPPLFARFKSKHHHHHHRARAPAAYRAALAAPHNAPAPRVRDLSGDVVFVRRRAVQPADVDQALDQLFNRHGPAQKREELRVHPGAGLRNLLS